MIPRRHKRWLPLLLAGLLLGAGGGLLVGWFLWPLQYVDAELSLLATADRNAYIDLVGLNYALDKDLPEAQGRLYPLQLESMTIAVVQRALVHIARQPDSDMARGLALLARDVGADSAAIARFLASSDVQP